MDRKLELAEAEIRWFWRDQLPDRLESWFRSVTQHGYPARGGEGGTELFATGEARWALAGIDDVACDFLEPRPDEIVNSPPFVGPVQRRTKHAHGLGRQMSNEAGMVARKRWLRIFDTSDGWAREVALAPGGGRADGKLWARCGCICELAKLETSDGTIWWSLGFEASGDPENVVRNLSLVASALAARHPPFWARGMLASYSQWLRQQIARTPSFPSPALA